MMQTLPPTPGTKTWVILSLEGKEGFLTVTEDQWWEVFRTGAFRGTKFQWMQPVGQPQHRVTFLENVQSDVTKLS